jgi:hypothetical protein
MPPDLRTSWWRLLLWYALNDGRVGTKLLDPPWDGHVSEADHLDVLANPKSGEIWRMLSTPSA